MSRMSVVLPAPSGPTSPVMTPAGTLAETSASAGASLAAKRCVNPRSSTAALTGWPNYEREPWSAKCTVTGIPWRSASSGSDTTMRAR